MNELVPQNFGAVSRVFGAVPATGDDLAAGVQGGFGLMKYKGKVWSLAYRGAETALMRDPDANGVVDGPRNSIEIVILKASQHISKIFYEQGYVEGSTAAPDCFSTNGLTPDAGAAKRQSPTCAACPKNAWGSKITPAGKQGKACSDSKRAAIVPLLDIKNEMFGGPMLLRIPAASLQELAQFGQKMQGLGYPYYSIGIRVAFDAAEAFPKFVFSAIRPLSDAEGELVLKMREEPLVGRILAEGAENVATQAGPVALPSPFEQPPAQQLAAPGAAPVVAAPVLQPVAPAPVVAPTPQPAVAAGVVTPVVSSGFGPVAAPVAAPVQAGLVTQPMAVAPANATPSTPAPVAAAPAPAPSGQSFEDTLDAKLDGLLPAA